MSASREDVDAFIRVKDDLALIREAYDDIADAASELLAKCPAEPGVRLPELDALEEAINRAKALLEWKPE